VTDPGRAVFLSYASQDAEAARRICEALRVAGIEVWFDQSALRGGDVWDQTIRKQIKTCVLFIPVVSRHTHERDEGYFRLEWKLAVERSHLMTPNKAFLLPVVVDDTREDDENVPDRFRDIHWTHLPAGETPPAFVELVRRLTSPEPSHGPTTTILAAAPESAATPLTRERVVAPWRSKQALPTVLAVVVAGALAYFGINKFWFSKYQASPPDSPAALASAAQGAFAPPPHSIAVLPFVNMSGDKEQEYFSDGLSEELLNDLSRINELQVAARTSAFSFKGKDTDIGTIARKLNVGAVLEGSVRRSAHTVRVTAQLINAVSGFHMWSQTYDRGSGDVLELQTEIAEAVASALKVTLLGDLAARIELGGTHNPAAFDAYLRGVRTAITHRNAKDLQTAIAAYTEAIWADPNYALAFARRSRASAAYANDYASTLDERKRAFDDSYADAQRAITLAPDLAEGHLALANFFETGTLDFARAGAECERALELGPGDARVLRDTSRFAARMGRANISVPAARRAVMLDPLGRATYESLGIVLFFAREYEQATGAFQHSLALDPDYPGASALLGLAYYALGRFQSARESCETKPGHWESQECLALTYQKLGRHADAKAMLAKLQAATGDDSAYQYAEINAQWGNSDEALRWLETARRLRDPGLAELKVNPLFDPLRKEPRFQAIERELKFPT
jgi:TolB-like protein/Tfp pilus assembly protein PilF